MMYNELGNQQSRYSPLPRHTFIPTPLPPPPPYEPHMQHGSGRPPFMPGAPGIPQPSWGFSSSMGAVSGFSPRSSSSRWPLQNQEMQQLHSQQQQQGLEQQLHLQQQQRLEQQLHAHQEQGLAQQLQVLEQQKQMLEQRQLQILFQEKHRQKQLLRQMRRQFNKATWQQQQQLQNVQQQEQQPQTPALQLLGNIASRPQGPAVSEGNSTDRNSQQVLGQGNGMNIERQLQTPALQLLGNIASRPQGPAVSEGNSTDRNSQQVLRQSNGMNMEGPVAGREPCDREVRRFLTAEEEEKGKRLLQHMRQNLFESNLCHNSRGLPSVRDQTTGPVLVGNEPSMMQNPSHGGSTFTVSQRNVVEAPYQLPGGDRMVASYQRPSQTQASQLNETLHHQGADTSANIFVRNICSDNPLPYSAHHQQASSRNSSGGREAFLHTQPSQHNSNTMGNRGIHAPSLTSGLSPYRAQQLNLQHGSRQSFAGTSADHNHSGHDWQMAPVGENRMPPAGSGTFPMPQQQVLQQGSGAHPGLAPSEAFRRNAYHQAITRCTPAGALGRSADHQGNTQHQMFQSEPQSAPVGNSAWTSGAPHTAASCQPSNPQQVQARRHSTGSTTSSSATYHQEGQTRQQVSPTVEPSLQLQDSSRLTDRISTSTSGQQEKDRGQPGPTRASEASDAVKKLEENQQCSFGGWSHHPWLKSAHSLLSGQNLSDQQSQLERKASEQSKSVQPSCSSHDTDVIFVRDCSSTAVIPTDLACSQPSSSMTVTPAGLASVLTSSVVTPTGLPIAQPSSNSVVTTTNLPRTRCSISSVVTPANLPSALWSTTSVMTPRNLPSGQSSISMAATPTSARCSSNMARTIPHNPGPYERESTVFNLCPDVMKPVTGANPQPTSLPFSGRRWHQPAEPKQGPAIPDSNPMLAQLLVDESGSQISTDCVPGTPVLQPSRKGSASSTSEGQVAVAQDDTEDVGHGKEVDGSRRSSDQEVSQQQDNFGTCQSTATRMAAKHVLNGNSRSLEEENAGESRESKAHQSKRPRNRRTWSSPGNLTRDPLAERSLQDLVLSSRRIQRSLNNSEDTVHRILEVMAANPIQTEDNLSWTASPQSSSARSGTQGNQGSARDLPAGLTGQPGPSLTSDTALLPESGSVQTSKTTTAKSSCQPGNGQDSGEDFQSDPHVPAPRLARQLSKNRSESSCQSHSDSPVLPSLTGPGLGTEGGAERAQNLPHKAPPSFSSPHHVSEIADSSNNTLASVACHAVAEPSAEVSNPSSPSHWQFSDDAEFGHAGNFDTQPETPVMNAEEFIDMIFRRIDSDGKPPDVEESVQGCNWSEYISSPLRYKPLKENSQPSLPPRHMSSNDNSQPTSPPRHMRHVPSNDINWPSSQPRYKPSNDKNQPYSPARHVPSNDNNQLNSPPRHVPSNDNNQPNSPPRHVPSNDNNQPNSPPRHVPSNDNNQQNVQDEMLNSRLCEKVAKSPHSEIPHRESLSGRVNEIAATELASEGQMDSNPLFRSVMESKKLSPVQTIASIATTETSQTREAEERSEEDSLKSGSETLANDEATEQLSNKREQDGKAVLHVEREGESSHEGSPCRAETFSSTGTHLVEMEPVDSRDEDLHASTEPSPEEDVQDLSRHEQASLLPGEDIPAQNVSQGEEDHKGFQQFLFSAFADCFKASPAKTDRPVSLGLATSVDGTLDVEKPEKTQVEPQSAVRVGAGILGAELQMLENHLMQKEYGNSNEDYHHVSDKQSEENAVQDFSGDEQMPNPPEAVIPSQNVYEKEDVERSKRSLFFELLQSFEASPDGRDTSESPALGEAVSATHRKEESEKMAKEPQPGERRNSTPPKPLKSYPFFCKICNKSFSFRPYFQMHMTSHEVIEAHESNEEGESQIPQLCQAVQAARKSTGTSEGQGSEQGRLSDGREARGERILKTQAGNLQVGDDASPAKPSGLEAAIHEGCQGLDPVSPNTEKENTDAQHLEDNLESCHVTMTGESHNPHAEHYPQGSKYCNLCNGFVNNYRSHVYHVHRAEYHVKKGKLLHCFICGEEKNRFFSTERKLKRHFWRRHKADLKCIWCGKVYSFPESLNKHLQERHPHQEKSTSPKQVQVSAAAEMEPSKDKLESDTTQNSPEMIKEGETVTHSGGSPHKRSRLGISTDDQDSSASKQQVVSVSQLSVQSSASRAGKSGHVAGKHKRRDTSKDKDSSARKKPRADSKSERVSLHKKSRGDTVRDDRDSCARKRQAADSTSESALHHKRSKQEAGDDGDSPAREQPPADNRRVSVSQPRVQSSSSSAGNKGHSAGKESKHRDSTRDNRDSSAKRRHSVDRKGESVSGQKKIRVDTTRGDRDSSAGRQMLFDSRSDNTSGQKHQLDMTNDRGSSARKQWSFDSKGKSVSQLKKVRQDTTRDDRDSPARKQQSASSRSGSDTGKSSQDRIRDDQDSSARKQRLVDHKSMRASRSRSSSAGRNGHTGRKDSKHRDRRDDRNSSGRKQRSVDDTLMNASLHHTHSNASFAGKHSLSGSTDSKHHDTSRDKRDFSYRKHGPVDNRAESVPQHKRSRLDTARDGRDSSVRRQPVYSRSESVSWLSMPSSSSDARQNAQSARRSSWHCDGMPIEFSCILCSSRFSSQEAHSAHMKLMCDLIMRLRCSQCPGEALTFTAMERHMKNWHSDPRFEKQTSVSQRQSTPAANLGSSSSHPPPQARDGKFISLSRASISVELVSTLDIEADEWDGANGRSTGVSDSERRQAVRCAARALATLRAMEQQSSCELIPNAPPGQSGSHASTNGGLDSSTAGSESAQGARPTCPACGQTYVEKLLKEHVAEAHESLFRLYLKWRMKNSLSILSLNRVLGVREWHRW